jgi:uncharacterized SAM-binding protein YcdF (DUF218 family)
MFFYASKILFFPFVPSMLLTLVAVAGVLLSLTERWRRFGVRLSVLGVALLLVAGLSPLGNVLIMPLEERFARPRLEPGEQVAGIIILGGFEDGRISAARGSLEINEAGDRITEGVALALRFRSAKVVFTGGVGALVESYPPGAPAVRAFLTAVGVAPNRIVIEDRSRTTWENAELTRNAVRPKPGERWLLVTSAFHMPRSIGVFRKAGFEVVAWPADYRTKGPADTYRFFSRMPEGLERLDVAVKEWVGLVVYRLTGRTSALWPEP